jgi:hypothetical protein
MHDQLVPGPAWNPGRPGASAHAEYERRLRREEVRRNERFGRYVGPIVGALSGPDPRTANWRRGGDGEERVGLYLTRAVGRRGILLHDRAQGLRANIDHLAVVPSGVWVIDTKRYRGRVQKRGGWFGSPSLFVNGRNRNNLIAGAVAQRQRVQDALGSSIKVHVALCFTDGEWGFFAQPFTMRGVVVTWPRRLVATLLGAGPLATRERDLVAARLDDAFPSYAPSGTSHKPTGP